MIKVRKGVFETNSSSTHSICISNIEELLDILPLNDEGNIILTGGEFGWEQDEYNDATTKANYIAVMILILESAKNDFNNREDKDIFKYYSLPEFAHINYELCKNNFEEVLKEQTGCNYIDYDCTLEYSPKDGKSLSYIDHQSFEDKSDAKWLLDKELIKNFIFNKKSILITDNDNY